MGLCNTSAVEGEVTWWFFFWILAWYAGVLDGERLIMVK